MMLFSASWLILSIHILASYSNSAIQNVLNTRSPRKERIYFPGQLESFSQSDLEDRNVRVARLGTIPAEPPQGQFSWVCSWLLLWSTFHCVPPQVRDVVAGTTMDAGVVLQTIPVAWAKVTVTAPLTAARTTDTRVARGSWCAGATTA